jgi:hypothetical protein
MRLSKLIAGIAVLSLLCVVAEAQDFTLFGPEISREILRSQSAEQPAERVEFFGVQPVSCVLDLFASRETPAAGGEARAVDDPRPVIDAYSIDRCTPCEQNQKEIGEGDARVRIRWHHDARGEAFPWHIHNHAMVQGYPVYYFQDAAGQWRRTSGTRSLDQLSQLVGRGVKVAAR